MGCCGWREQGEAEAAAHVLSVSHADDVTTGDRGNCPRLGFFQVSFLCVRVLVSVSLSLSPVDDD